MQPSLRPNPTPHSLSLPLPSSNLKAVKEEWVHHRFLSFLSTPDSEDPQPALPRLCSVALGQLCNPLCPSLHVLK